MTRREKEQLREALRCLMQSDKWEVDLVPLSVFEMMSTVGRPFKAVERKNQGDGKE
jgi:hypothetical protein